MDLEKENWRSGSDENQENAYSGNGKPFNRENRYNKGFDGGSRSNYYRNNGGYNRSERSQRPRFTRSNEEGGEQRPRFTRVNGNDDSRSYRSSRSYEGGGYRSSYSRGNNSGYGGGHYSSRGRYNSNTEDWNVDIHTDGLEERPRFHRAANNGGSFYRSDDRPQYRGSNRSQRGSAPRHRTEGYNPNAKYSRKKQIEYKELLTDPDAPIRLNKYLANAGICSRREADEFIAAGVVSVNGEVVTELGTKVKRTDLIKFHDEPVNAERKVYILLNKPKDCVTTSDDPQDRKTVMDLVKGACNERIYPVGRLDRNTTGVLLLTNDGDLASKLTHPKFLKKKVYHVYCDKNVAKSDLEQIATGIMLEDGEIHADAISYVSDTDKSQVGIEIHSGKNRIVRRIFESLGYRVIKLDRVMFAGLTKKNLRRGDWRFLTEKEVNMLRMGAFE